MKKLIIIIVFDDEIIVKLSGISDKFYLKNWKEVITVLSFLNLDIAENIFVSSLRYKMNKRNE